MWIRLFELDLELVQFSSVAQSCTSLYHPCTGEQVFCSDSRTSVSPCVLHSVVGTAGN